jgi:hypothetical protein
MDFTVALKIGCTSGLDYFDEAQNILGGVECVYHMFKP